MASLMLFFSLCCIPSPARSQDTSFQAKHAAIFFPYPMYNERWRSSIGFTLLTLPEDLTEQVILRVPCGDWHVLHRLNNDFLLDARLSFQFLQNHLAVGFKWLRPLSKDWYLSAGDDMGVWFGKLNIASFNSSGIGLLNYPNLSIGYKTRKELLITFKAQVSVNLFTELANGKQVTNKGRNFYNGETFTLALEQAFYHQKHLTLAFSAINNYFYWQTWPLFYKLDRKVFYPQVTVGFIL